MANGYSVAEIIRGQLQGSAPAETVRDIEAVTCEILHLKQELAQNIVDIGLRLLEAKDMLPHGEWLPWLKDNVCFSEATAQRYMKVAKEFPNPALVRDLGVRKALALLELPPSEREAFAEDNNVVDMTTAQLEKAIRERDEAKQAAEAARAEARTAGEARAKMETDMRALKEIHTSAVSEAEEAVAALLAAQKELEELRKRPVDVAVETVVDQKAVEKARAAAITEMQAKVDAAEKARKEAEARRKDAEKALADARKRSSDRAAILSRAERAEAELAEAKRQLEAAGRAEKASPLRSDGDLASFRLLFDQAQNQVNQLHGLLLKIQGRDEASAGELKRALLALADSVRRCAE